MVSLSTLHLALINEGEFLEIYKITLSKEDMIDMENEMTTLLISRRFSSAAMPVMITHMYIDM